MNLILPLSITLAIETGIYMILKHKNLKLFIVVSILNLILNPLMNVGLSYIEEKLIYYLVLSAAEIATILIESLVVYLFIKEKYLKVLLYAAIANISSFLIGFVLTFTPIYQTRITIIVIVVLFLSVYLFIYIVTLLAFIRNYRNRDDNRRRNEENSQDN